MNSPATTDLFTQCLDDLHKLINIRHRFYLRNQLELNPPYKFIHKLKDDLDLLINKKAKETSNSAPLNMPIDQTLRLGTLKSLLHNQDLRNPSINNLFGRSLFQVAAQLKESPRPMTVEHMWQIAEVCRVCGDNGMDGFEKVLGKRYWRAFRRILEDQLAGEEVRMSGVSRARFGLS